MLNVSILYVLRGPLASEILKKGRGTDTGMDPGDILVWGSEMVEYKWGES